MGEGERYIHIVCVCVWWGKERDTYSVCVVGEGEIVCGVGEIYIVCGGGGEIYIVCGGGGKR